MVRANPVQRVLTVGMVASAIALACGRSPTSPVNNHLPLLSRAFVSSPGDQGVVYVSMTPGPALVSVRVTDLRSRTSFSPTVVDGGFDPVTTVASIGDTLLFSVKRSVRDSTLAIAVVPQSSKPGVVRSVPTSNDTAVNVHDSLVAIFSEPMDSASVAAGMRLEFDGAAVESSVSFAGCQSGLCGRLVPSLPLLGFSDFNFVLASSVASRNGVALGDSVVDAFTTGRPADAPPGTAQPLSVQSFAVIEYQVAGDSSNWYYAPRLTVTNGADGQADITGFAYAIEGLDSVSTDNCEAISVSPHATADLFQESQGQWDDRLVISRRATGPTVSAHLRYISGRYSFTMDLTGAVAPGEPPTTRTDRTDPWYPYC